MEEINGLKEQLSIAIGLLTAACDQVLLANQRVTTLEKRVFKLECNADGIWTRIKNRIYMEIWL